MLYLSVGCYREGETSPLVERGMRPATRLGNIFGRSVERGRERRLPYTWPCVDGEEFLGLAVSRHRCHAENEVSSALLRQSCTTVRRRARREGTTNDVETHRPTCLPRRCCPIALRHRHVSVDYGWTARHKPVIHRFDLHARHIFLDER